MIVFNPAAGLGRWRRLQRILPLLEARGCRWELRETTAPGDAEAIARAADPALVDRLVVAGGDGTINEAINGLAGSDLPLAIAPLGTANVLAHEIGLAADPGAIAATIAEGAPQAVALGLANGRRFTLMAGVGFDAHVVAHVRLPAKRWLGKGAYVLAFCGRLAAYRFPGYRVVADGTEWRAASVVVANGRHYAGPFVCAPAADIGTPALEVCLFERTGRLAALRYALGLFSGRLPRVPGFRTVTATRVTIAGPKGDPVQGDGDIIARLPVEITVEPAALRLVMPRGP